VKTDDPLMMKILKALGIIIASSKSCNENTVKN